MIDLHCHLLPGIDDGAPDIEASVAMAKLAHADGIEITCCTPHIYPGLYENTGPDIRRRVANLQAVLQAQQIPLQLMVGADAHLVPEFLGGIRSGHIPTIAGSRYVLLEPPHTVRPPRFQESVFAVIGAGYTPIITHPERLTWVEGHYTEFVDLARSGAWLQITGGALLGSFGPRAERYARRFVDEGWCDVLASDGHSPARRRPLLGEARVAAAKLVGVEEARRMVLDRPRAVLDHRSSSEVLRPPAHANAALGSQGKIGSLFGRVAARLFGAAPRE